MKLIRSANEGELAMLFIEYRGRHGDGQVAVLLVSNETGELGGNEVELTKRVRREGRKEAGPGDFIRATHGGRACSSDKNVEGEEGCQTS